MRNLLAFLAAVTLTIAGLGWYLDWYRIGNGPAPSAGHHNVTIDINTVKIGEDIHRGEERLQKMLQDAGKDKDKTSGSTGKAAKGGTDKALPPKGDKKDGKESVFPPGTPQD